MIRRLGWVCSPYAVAETRPAMGAEAPAVRAKKPLPPEEGQERRKSKAGNEPYFLRLRAASPASASSESIAVAGSGMASATTLMFVIWVFIPAALPTVEVSTVWKTIAYDVYSPSWRSTETV